MSMAVHVLVHVHVLLFSSHCSTYSIYCSLFRSIARPSKDAMIKLKEEAIFFNMNCHSRTLYNLDCKTGLW